MDTRIGKANRVLNEIYRSVFTKRELSRRSKLSFKIFFFKMCICEIRETLNVEQLLMEKSLLYWLDHVKRMSQKKFGDTNYCLDARKSSPEVDQGPDDVFTSLILLGPLMV